MDNRKENIEKYLDGLMSADELRDFNVQLSKDKQLLAQLEEARLARIVIEEAGRLNLKNTLQRFDDEMVAGNSKVQTKVMRLWLKRTIPLAAILVVFFGIFQFMNTTVSLTKAYDDAFEVYQAPSSIRSNDNAVKLNWETAIKFYKNEDFSNALVYFTKAKGEAPEYLVHFYIGLSAMSQENPNDALAEEYFFRVLQTDNDFKQQAKWYRGLVLLRMGEHGKAITVFKDIVEKKSYAYKKAQKLTRLKIK